MCAGAAARVGDRVGIASAIGGGRGDGVLPGTAVALERGFGSKDVADCCVGVVDGGNADLGLARSFCAPYDLVFGDEIGVGVEPVVAERLTAFTVVEPRGGVRERSVERPEGVRAE